MASPIKWDDSLDDVLRQVPIVKRSAEDAFEDDEAADNVVSALDVNSYVKKY